MFDEISVTLKKVVVGLDPEKGRLIPLAPKNPRSRLHQFEP